VLVIPRKTLALHWHRYPPARDPLASWCKVIEEASFLNFADVQRTFSSAFRTRKHVVFDVDGHRVVTLIQFNRGKLFVRRIFSPAEFEQIERLVRKGK
jgi:mRNA-degrading endonuclease HigB of HigAB toxin-antitoxin module